MRKIMFIIFCIAAITTCQISYAQPTPPPIEKAGDSTSKITAPSSGKETGDTTEQQTTIPKHKKYRNDAELAIKDGKYLTAMRSLLKEKDEVNKLLGKKLEKALPKKSGELEMSYSEETERNFFDILKPDLNLFYMVRVYSQTGMKDKYDTIMDERRVPPVIGEAGPQKSKPEPQYNMRIVRTQKYPRLTLSISNYVDYFDAVNRVYELDSNDPLRMIAPGSEETKLMVNGERAFYQYNKDSKKGDFFMNAGTFVLVIRGEKIESADILKTIAEAIDYKMLKENLQ